MLSLAASTSNGIFDIATNVFSRADTLANPGTLLDQLQQMSVVWAAILLSAGIVCLLHGHKYYRTVVVILALFIGAVVGYALGKRVQADYIVAGCLGALFAVCCWPLMKYAVALMGGLAGAFLGANAWSAVAATMNTAGNGATPDPKQNMYWVGALVGLIVCGMLAFVLFKLTIVMFTSVSGATFAVLGAVALLLQVPAWNSGIRDSMGRNAIALPLLVMVPALIGLIMQHSKPGASTATPGGGAKPAAPKPA